MADKLSEYQRKRDFSKTSEPAGGQAPSGPALRYVIQLHAASHLHYDFRLEWGGTMVSWAVPKGPSYNPKDKRLAVHVEDHPLDYRHFEGTIPKGQYGGGTVMLWDEGTWEPLEDMDKAMAEGSLKLRLHGQRLQGDWALVRMKGRENSDKNWLLIKEKDDRAASASGIAQYTTSVRSGRTMEQITRGEAAPSLAGDPPEPDPVPVTLPFQQLQVQLATASPNLPSEPGWLYELKYDGYRMVAFTDASGVRLLTRNGLDWTRKFPEVAAAVAGLPLACVLDGEIVATDARGRTDFSSLQASLKADATSGRSYMVFDLLAEGDTDLRGLPLVERKARLRQVLPAPHPVLRYSAHADVPGQEVLDAACQEDMEGVICKKAQAPYTSGRGVGWLKVKCDNRQEFVIGGYTRSAKSTTGLSSLLVGLWSHQRLEYAGRVGSGFSDETAQDLLARLAPLTRPASPFVQPPEPRPREQVVWLEPEVVAQVRFAERTADGLLRQASFKGLREDKAAAEVEEDKIVASPKGHSPKKTPSPSRQGKSDTTASVAGISLSRPDKLLYPEAGVTKEMVARYYQAVAPRMLPYVRRRPMTLVRCPDGAGIAECFYQKHLDKPLPGLALQRLLENDGQEATYFYVQDVAGLVSAVQLGALEFHPWGSTVDQLETPDFMVFDLDPDVGLSLERVRQGVRHMRQVLAEAGLTSFLKTSGGKGYHVVVPLTPSAPWPVVRDFAELVGRAMEQRWPDLYTANMRKVKRQGRIFVDWVRNGRGATSVAPYSLRARPTAAVSWPMAWEELDRIGPADITYAMALERLATGAVDPWTGFFTSEQRLQPRG